MSLNSALSKFSLEELIKEIETRKATPKKIKFIWYTRSDYSISEIQDVIEDRTGYAISYHLAEAIANKFYEVKHECEIDTKTGKITIL